LGRRKAKGPDSPGRTVVSLPPGAVEIFIYIYMLKGMQVRSGKVKPRKGLTGQWGVLRFNHRGILPELHVLIFRYSSKVID